MAGDRDLSSLLPDAPPPRPARRAAAIETALRRFDGIPDPPAAAAVPTLARPGWWQRFGGPQTGAVVAILLAAIVALPIWVSERDRLVPPPVASEQKEGPAVASPKDAPTRERVAEPAHTTDVKAARTTAPRPTAPAREVPSSPAVAARVPSVMPEPAPMPPPAPAPQAEIVVSAQRRQEQNFSAPVAITAVTSDSLDRAKPSRKAAGRVASEEDEAAEVVVTGTLINSADARASRAASRRGDWNACTIDDPQRSVERCRKRVDPATPLGEGIVEAWEGDLDGAIAAFDRAIAAQPRKPAAWLNRALVHAREGDYDKALADLDRVVRIEPGAARNFYHRSVVYRRLGDMRRADRDATRVLEMDSRYRDLIP